MLISKEELAQAVQCIEQAAELLDATTIGRMVYQQVEDLRHGRSGAGSTDLSKTLGLLGARLQLTAIESRYV